DLAVHPLELVQPDDGPPLGAHAYRADDLERLGIEERNPLGSVAHDEPLAVRREPPALARVAERAGPLERRDVVDEADLVHPRQLIELAAEDRNALAEIKLAQRLIPLHVPARQRDAPNRRRAVLPGPFVQGAVV